MTLLNIGIVGCGRIAQTHLAALREAPACQAQWRLAGVCDVDAAAARQAVQEFPGARTFDDHRRLAEQARLDAAIVCTPPATHPRLVIDLLERGVAVLCEKPLATSLEAAQQMRDAAQRAGRLLLMASKFRFVEDVARARELVASGLLGEAGLVTICFCAPLAMADRWNADPVLSGGGVIMDNGPHAADLARFLLGPVTRVQAHASRRLQSLAVEDTARLGLECQSGASAVVDLSWSLAAGGDYLSLAATGGALALGWSQSRYRLHGSRDWVSLGGGYDKSAAFAAQLRHFAACVRGEGQPQTQPQCAVEDAVASVAVTEAAYRSLRTARWETV